MVPDGADMTNMHQNILLCSDLDRTLLPNGVEPESLLARPLFRALSERSDICLAYVSGRDLHLLQQAVDEYQLPIPDFAIGDVGTTIYQINKGEWVSWTDWQEAIAPDWKGHDHADLSHLLADMPELQLQPEYKQNRFKLSYFTPIDVDTTALLTTIDARLQPLAVSASLIWSVDEADSVGLLDILPSCATKLGAIRFLMQRAGYSAQQTVFAGDSGNDLPVLTSGLHSILVRNAHANVRREALASLSVNDQHKLYQARGGFLDMNGHYAAGVLEGLVHFHPQLRMWMTKVAVSDGSRHDDL
jgi:hypothetical protein